MLSPIITISLVTSSSATLSFSQPSNSLPVDIYNISLTSTTCNGVPSRTESTTSNSLTIGSLESGIQYSVSVAGKNSVLNSAGTERTTLTTNVTGIQIYVRIKPFVKLLCLI